MEKCSGWAPNTHFLIHVLYLEYCFLLFSFLWGGILTKIWWWRHNGNLTQSLCSVFVLMETHLFVSVLSGKIGQQEVWSYYTNEFPSLWHKHSLTSTLFCYSDENELWTWRFIELIESWQPIPKLSFSLPFLLWLAEKSSFELWLNVSCAHKFNKPSHWNYYSRNVHCCWKWFLFLWRSSPCSYL